MGAPAAAAALLLGTITAAPSGAADPLGQITVEATGGATAGFTADVGPSDITVGPDGLIWFLETDGGHPIEQPEGAPVPEVGASGFGVPMSGSVARRNADGSISEFDEGITGSSLMEITSGPDGNVWFTEFNSPGAIGRITPDGTITEVLVGGVGDMPPGNVEDIVTGPDGNLWFTMPFGNAGVGRLTPTGTLTHFPAPDGIAPRFLAVGPDGNLWLTHDGPTPGISTVTTSGAFTLVAEAGVTPGLPADSFPYDIVLGPDSNLWFTVVGGAGRITPAGAVTTFAAPGLEGAFMEDIASGCGSLWLTQGEEEGPQSAVLQVSTAGAFTSFTAGMPSAAGAYGITFGPDDDLWFTGRNDPGRVLSIGAGCGEPPVTTTTTGVTPTTTGGAAAARPVSANPNLAG